MSQENVEIVRKTIEARNRDIEEWLTFFHPAAVTVTWRRPREANRRDPGS